jgi:hypothetical protein
MHLEEPSLIEQSCEYLRSWAYNTLKQTEKSGVKYPTLLQPPPFATVSREK